MIHRLEFRLKIFLEIGTQVIRVSNNSLSSSTTIRRLRGQNGEKFSPEFHHFILFRIKMCSLYRQCIYSTIQQELGIGFSNTVLVIKKSYSFSFNLSNCDFNVCKWLTFQIQFSAIHTLFNLLGFSFFEYERFQQIT